MNFMPNKKYNTYAELAAAFKSGELSEHYYLMLDKGGQENILCFHDPAESDAINDVRSDEARAMFEGDRPVEELFEALGIRAEWC